MGAKYGTKVQYGVRSRRRYREEDAKEGVVSMMLLILLAVAAVVVAVGALQNGQAVTVSFLFWKFDASLALVILAATAAGLLIGGLVGGAHALNRWRHRAVGSPPPESGVVGRDGAPPAAVSSVGTRSRRWMSR